MIIKNNFLKEAVVLLIFVVLLLSNLSVIASTPINTSKISNQKNEESHVPSEQPIGTYKLICEENFSCGQVPPKGGKYGDWTNKSLSDGLTWICSTNHPNTEPYCAEVRRGFTWNQSDEWLISPSMDFSKITDTKIFMDFWIRGHFYTASTLFLDNVDFLVKVSTNNGGKWDIIWSDDIIKENVYTDWEGHTIKKLELTEFKGNASVLIGFHFLTINNISRELQYFYLDDVYIYNETDIKLTVDHGGPYHWEILRQLDYPIKGVRFHGSVEEYLPIQCSWFWEFGDGKKRLKLFDPDIIHFYNSTGVYKINLTVTHLGKGVFTEVNTTLTLFTGPLPDIDINVKKLSIGVKAEIVSHAPVNATFVNWKIDAEWGPLRTRGEVIGEGTIENLVPNESQYIESIPWFLRPAYVFIVITMIPENIANVTKTFFAFKVGPLIIGAFEV